MKNKKGCRKKSKFLSRTRNQIKKDSEKLKYILNLSKGINFRKGYQKAKEEELKFLKSLTWFNMNKKVRLRIDRRIKESEDEE